MCMLAYRRRLYSQCNCNLFTGKLLPVLKAQYSLVYFV